jgi:hypothetical protein
VDIGLVSCGKAGDWPWCWREEVAQLRRAIKDAKYVYVRGEADILFKVSKREALRTIRPGCVLGTVKVYKFRDSLFVGAGDHS